MEDIELDADTEAWVPYAQRSDWADVHPLDIDDGRKVVAIRYTDDHLQCLGYFRAIMAKREFSPRVLDLTADLIHFNSADYTAWEYRQARAGNCRRCKLVRKT